MVRGSRDADPEAPPDCDIRIAVGSTSSWVSVDTSDGDAYEVLVVRQREDEDDDGGYVHAVVLDAQARVVLAAPIAPLDPRDDIELADQLMAMVLAPRGLAS